MSLGLNVNNYAKMPAVSKNETASSFNNTQNVSFKAQNYSGQDIYQTQYTEPKSSKGFWAVFTLATGAALAAIAYHYRGKTPSAKEASAAAQAVNAASNSANKAEGAANNEGKTSFIQFIKNKIKSLGEDMQKGFDEHKPVPGSTNPKTKNHNLPLNDKINALLITVNGEVSSIVKASEGVEAFAVSSQKASENAFDALNRNTETGNWIHRILNDYSAAPSSSLQRAGIGKSNAFVRTGTDSWIYTEGYSKSLSKTTAKAKRRISVNADGMTVALDNVKNSKKNIETAKEVIKYNNATGEVRHFKNYKLTPDGVQYSQGITMPAGASAPEKYTEGCVELSDGTIKAARGTYGDASGIQACYEGKTEYTDGKTTYSKILNLDSSGRPEFYNEDIVRYADGTRKSARQFRFTDDGCEYYEGFNVKRSAKITAEKKVEFDENKNPVCRMEGYKEKPFTGFSADTRIEYKPGTNEPKYYYENYKYDDATGRETYSLKAKFKKGKWTKVR